MPATPEPGASGSGISTCLRHVLAGGILVALVATGFGLSGNEQYGRNVAFTLLAGVAFGMVLQRSRFCFFCILREFFEDHDGRALLGVLLALFIGGAGYLVLFGAWIEADAGWLPDRAHIGPTSWALALGGLLFGWGMALSGSCIGAHLYRLGEGSLLSPIALAGSVLGFMLGFLAWNTLYLRAIQSAPVPWLPAYTGYFWAFVIQSTVLAALAVWILLRRLPHGGAESSVRGSGMPRTLAELWRVVAVYRWPTAGGGIGVGLLGLLVYFRTEPLGVTSQLGSLARHTGGALNLIPLRLEGLDGFAGCATAPQSSLLTQNGIFVLALIAGSLFTALLANQFQPERKSPRQYLFALMGGILLGFGAMISLGCSIGTLLSGIMAFALSGWCFAVAMTFGVWTGLLFRRAYIPFP
jgi:uncharacterized protein